jgi:biotin carboxyl carrier protein
MSTLSSVKKNSGDTLKVSGKRFSLPGSEGAWRFESRPGGWIIATDSSGARVRFAASEIKNKLGYAIVSEGARCSGYGEILAASHGGGGQGSKAAIDSDLTAQFPGKVRKILVQEGTSVASGDPLILVEAMKMEFAVKAPVAGKVSKLHVVEGQQLAPGQKFLDFIVEGSSDGK